MKLTVTRSALEKTAGRWRRFLAKAFVDSPEHAAHAAVLMSGGANARAFAPAALDSDAKTLIRLKKLVSRHVGQPAERLSLLERQADRKASQGYGVARPSVKASGKYVTVYHGTSTKYVPGIKGNGGQIFVHHQSLRNPAVRERLKFYADRAVAGVGGEPVVLALRVDKAHLRGHNVAHERILSAAGLKDAKAVHAIPGRHLQAGLERQRRLGVAETPVHLLTR